MKFHPNYIILRQALRYLPDEEQDFLINKLSKYNIKGKPFLKALKNNFDVEKLKDHPLIWQDIWLYNYIKYETNEGLRRNGLIALYEKQIFFIDDSEFFKKREAINKIPIMESVYSKKKPKNHS